MNTDVPQPDDLTVEWWQATTERRLVVQTCRACGHAQHPPRAVCVACSDTSQLVLADSTGEGTVDSWTVVHRAPRPGVDVPYTIVRVRLSEGPIVLSVLEGDEEPALDDPVALSWWDLPDGRALPIFRLADTTEQGG